ncbi:MAG TPA: methyltransferase domain-containing protein [Cyclobacteriaceae bacterium]|jgi:hypothetical protein|nr:methyltransferase domain-containing protein [Cyclobacteriaceae bacterium]
MKIDSRIVPYLVGKEFSNGVVFPIATKYSNQDRISYIVKECTDKRVIHIGFADHTPLIPTKIENNTWLHARLLKVCKKCIGVDVDKEAFDFVTNNYSYPDLYLHNVINDEPLTAIVNEKWDYMVMGEILEHVDDPVSFLKQLHEKYGAYVKKLIITVPNFMDFINIRMAKNHKEYINSDHRFWFSPYTLAKVGTRAGWKPLEFEFSQSHQPQRWLYRKIVERYPSFRETLIMIFES